METINLNQTPFEIVAQKQSNRDARRRAYACARDQTLARKEELRISAGIGSTDPSEIAEPLSIAQMPTVKRLSNKRRLNRALTHENPSTEFYTYLAPTTKRVKSTGPSSASLYRGKESYPFMFPAIDDVAFSTRRYIDRSYEWPVQELAFYRQVQLIGRGRLDVPMSYFKRYCALQDACPETYDPIPEEPYVTSDDWGFDSIDELQMFSPVNPRSPDDLPLAMRLWREAYVYSHPLFVDEYRPFYFSALDPPVFMIPSPLNDLLTLGESIDTVQANDHLIPDPADGGEPQVASVDEAIIQAMRKAMVFLGQPRPGDSFAERKVLRDLAIEFGALAEPIQELQADDYPTPLELDMEDEDLVPAGFFLDEIEGQKRAARIAQASRLGAAFRRIAPTLPPAAVAMEEIAPFVTSDQAADYLELESKVTPRQLIDGTPANKGEPDNFIFRFCRSIAAWFTKIKDQAVAGVFYMFIKPFLDSAMTYTKQKLASAFMTHLGRFLAFTVFLVSCALFKHLGLTGLQAVFVGAFSVLGLAIAGETVMFHWCALADYFSSIQTQAPGDEAEETSFQHFKGVASAFGVNFLHNTKEIAKLWTTVKSLQDFIAFLFEASPLFIQEAIFQYFPGSVSTLMYRSSGWLPIHKNLTDALVQLEACYSRALAQNVQLQLTQANTFLSRFMDKAWFQTASRDLTNFNANFSLICQRFDKARDKNPFLFVIGGGHGLAKTEMSKILLDRLASHVAERQVEASYYVRATSTPYWDGWNGQDFILYRDLFGRSNEVVTQDFDEICDLCDGEYEANFAFQNTDGKKGKGVKMCPLAIGAATNYQHPEVIPDVKNLMAYLRRRNLCIKALPSPTFRAHYSSRGPTTAWTTAVDNMSDEQKRMFHHISYCFVSPINDSDKGAVPGVPGVEFHQEFDAITLLRHVVTAYDNHATAKATNAKNFKSLLTLANTEDTAIKIVKPIVQVEVDTKLTGLLDTALKTAAVLAGVAAVVKLLMNNNEKTKQVKEIKFDAVTEVQSVRSTIPRGRGARTTGRVDQQPITSLQGSQVQQQLERLRKNIVSVQFGGVHSVYGVMIDAQTMLAPAHVFRVADKFIDRPFDVVTYDGVVLSQRLYPEDVHATQYHHSGRIYIKDAIQFRLQNPMRGFKDIRHMFTDAFIKPTRAYLVRTGGFLYFDDVNRSENYHPYSDGLVSKSLMVQCPFRYAAKTVKGDCGSALVVEDGGKLVIVGIHSGAHGGKVGYSVPISRESLLDSQMNLQTIETVSSLQAVDFDASIDVPSPQFRSEGYNPRRVHTPMKDRLKRSLFPYVEGVAITEKSLEQLYVSEARFGTLCVKPMSRQQHLFSLAVVDNLYTSQMHNSPPGQVWNPQQAVDNLKPDASVGYGFAHKRSVLAPKTVPGTIPVTDTSRMHPDLRSRLESLIEDVKAGNWPMAVIMPCLKDETTTIEKNLIGKVRSFEVSSLEFTIFGEMLFGDLMVYLKQFNAHLPIATGFDVNSTDYHNMMDRLEKFSPCWFDADYKGFETFVNWHLAEAFHTVCDRFYAADDEKQGWTKHARRAYIAAMLSPAVVVSHSVWTRFYSNPSGMIATLQLNSIVNTYLVAYAYKSVFPDAIPSDFEHDVRHEVTGDDLLMAVKSDTVSRFNQVTFIKALAELGITATPGDKSADPAPYTDRTKCTFLKTRPLYSDEFGGFVAFVEDELLEKRLVYCRDETKEGQTALALSILHEASMHGTRKQKEFPQCRTYPEWVEYVRQYIPDIKAPTFSEVLANYHRFPIDADEDVIVVDDEFDMEIIDELQGNKQFSAYNIFGNNNQVKGEQSATEETTLKMSAAVAVEGGSATSGGIDEGPKNKDIRYVESDLMDDHKHAPGKKGVKLDKPEHRFVVFNTDEPTILQPTMTGVDTSQFLGDRACIIDGVTTDDFHGGEDQMSQAFFTRHFTCFDRKTIPYTTSSGTLIAQYDLSPFQTMPRAILCEPLIPTSGDASFYLTRLEQWASQFGYWRGGLDFRFKIVAPREYSVRLAFVIAYQDYERVAPADYEHAVTTTTSIVNFDAAKREAVIRCAYVSPHDWLLPFFRDANNAVDSNVAYPTSSLGTLRVYASTKPAGPAADYTALPELFVYSAASPDFQTKRYLAVAGMQWRSELPEPITQLQSAEGTTLLPVGQKLQLSGGINSNQVAPINLRKFALKFAHKQTISLNASTMPIVEWKHPEETLIAQAKYAQQAMRFFRGDLVVQVAPTVSGWVGGMYWLVWIPYGTSGNYDSSMVAITCNDYIELDLAGDKPIEIIIPFRYQKEFFVSGGSKTNYGIVKLFPASPSLQVPSTGTVTADLDVNMAWRNFESFVPSEIGDSPMPSVFGEPVTMLQSAGDTAIEVDMNTAVTSKEIAQEPTEAPLVSMLYGSDARIINHLSDLIKRTRPGYIYKIDTAALTTNPNVIAWIPQPFSADNSSALWTQYRAWKGDLIVTLEVLDYDNDEWCVALLPFGPQIAYSPSDPWLAQFVSQLLDPASTAYIPNIGPVYTVGLYGLPPTMAGYPISFTRSKRMRFVTPFQHQNRFIVNNRSANTEIPINDTVPQSIGFARWIPDQNGSATVRHVRVNHECADSFGFSHYAPTQLYMAVPRYGAPLTGPFTYANFPGQYFQLVAPPPLPAKKS